MKPELEFDTEVCESRTALGSSAWDGGNRRPSFKPTISVWDKLLPLLRSYTRLKRFSGDDGTLNDDLFQETIVELLQHAGSDLGPLVRDGLLDDNGEVGPRHRTLLNRIVNRSYKRVQRRYRQRTVSRVELESLETGQDNPAEVAQEADLETALGRAIEGLPLVERNVLRARYFDKLTLREIAAKFGFSMPTVNRIVRRALYDLKCGFAPDEVV